MSRERVQTVPGWAEVSWLSAGFSGRYGGISQGFGGGEETGLLNLGFGVPDDPAAVVENRRRLLESVGGGDNTGTRGEGVWRLAVARQVHGVEVREVTEGNLGEAMEDGRGRWEADGLITQAPGLLLGVGAADCVPLLVADLRLRAVGAFHAGWRGTAAGMAGVGLRHMAEAFGTRAEDCVAAVGPSIGACCYEVGDEVRAAFMARGEGPGSKGHRGRAGQEVLVAREDGWRLNLWESNRRQLEDAGMRPDRVTVLGECTACSRDEAGRRRYFSHRAEAGATGRMLGVIGIRRGVGAGARSESAAGS